MAEPADVFALEEEQFLLIWKFLKPKFGTKRRTKTLQWKHG